MKDRIDHAAEAHRVISTMPSSDLITDAMVEAAARAEWTHEWPVRPWEKVPDDLADHYRDCSRHALEAAAPLIAAKALRYADESLARAASQVDTLHHFHGFKCLCGFEGDARARTQTEHITSMMLDTNASVRAERIERGES